MFIALIDDSRLNKYSSPDIPYQMDIFRAEIDAMTNIYKACINMSDPALGRNEMWIEIPDTGYTKCKSSQKI